MKRIGVWLAVLLLTLSATQLPARAAENWTIPPAPGMLAPDDAITGSNAAFIGTHGQVLFDVSVIAKRLDGTVTWQNHNQTAIIETGSGPIILNAGSSTAHAQGRAVTLSAPVMAKGNSLYVPASFLLHFADTGGLSPVYAGAIDPVAMALLQREAPPIPQNLDIQIVAMASMHSPVARLDDHFTLNMRAQIRGKDELTYIDMTMPNFLLPAPDDEMNLLEEMPDTLHIANATKGGKSWLTGNGEPWQQLPDQEGGVWAQALAAASAATADPAAPAMDQDEAMKLMLDLLAGAHLGSNRVVNGHTEQDIVLELNTEKLDELTAQAMADTELVPPDGMGISWNVATITITMDPNTGMLSRFDLHLSARVEQKVIGRKLTIANVNLNLVMTLAANNQPIRWPASLLAQ